MSMFVENNQTMTTTVYYRRSKGGGMRVATTLDGIPEDQKKGYDKLVVTLTPMTWKRYNEVQRASLVDKRGTGSEEVDWLLYREKKLMVVLTGWDAKDEKGNPVPVNQENIYKLHPMIAETILAEYDRVAFLGEDERKN